MALGLTKYCHKRSFQSWTSNYCVLGDISIIMVHTIYYVWFQRFKELQTMILPPIGMRLYSSSFFVCTVPPISSQLTDFCLPTPPSLLSSSFTCLLTLFCPPLHFILFHPFPLLSLHPSFPILPRYFPSPLLNHLITRRTIDCMYQ